MKVAILGTGMIGTDLLIKVQRSQLLECSAFVGRREDSPGIAKARELGVRCETGSWHYLGGRSAIGEDHVIFLAHSAGDLPANPWKDWHRCCHFIDLTPGDQPNFCVPAWNINGAAKERLVSMISCGAQASIPLLTAAWSAMDEPIEYVEVVSSIAAKSAGPATRANIDEYIQRTEAAIQQFTGAPRAKAVLILNPAEPEVDMQTTMYIQPAPSDECLDAVSRAVEAAAERVRAYVPGYEVQFMERRHDRLAISVRVRGRGDWLPPYAGNLDIITSAAVALAEAKARSIK